MAVELDKRLQYYAAKLREAEELSAKASDPEVRQTWDGIADGYRVLLASLRNRRRRHRG